MKLTGFSCENYRNLKNVNISPVPTVNVICGENGQGKTNMVEAMWMFTGARSFRGAKENELVPLNGEQADLSITFNGFGRSQEMRLLYGKRKAAFLNGVEATSASAFSGSVCAIVFSPAHLSLVKGGPDERRRALDTVICQIKPRYQQVLNQYKHQLLQRNTLLKDAMLSSHLIDTLDIWDMGLAKTGALISKTRATYLQKLDPMAKDIYDGISGKREELQLKYEATAAVDGEISEEAMLSLLKENRNNDLRTGSTSIGPHRDDFDISLSGLSARSFGSQGQQRSAVLAFKLGECALMEEVTGETPIVLLDDVMSELDERRRDYLLHHLKDRQIFITCCDPHQIEGADAVFIADNGIITAM